jgi:hypothetical protein
VRDLEAVTRQRDDLAARLQEAKQAACRAVKCAQASGEELERLRRDACARNGDMLTAKSTIASLEIQVADTHSHNVMCESWEAAP